MTLKECYTILELDGSADLAEVKKAYRRLAFALHPDLHPDAPDASSRFQQLNEAYVVLSQTLASEEAKGRTRAFGAKKTDSTKAREDAQKAYEKARKQAGSSTDFADDAKREEAEELSKEDVLKDILSDPFARRVFEDIYSRIKYEHDTSNAQTKRAGATFSSPNTSSAAGSASSARRSAKARAAHAKSTAAPISPGTRRAKASGNDRAEKDGLLGGIKGWLRRQIDDEQELRLPGDQLVPGARVRLEIQHGFSGEPQTIELTLPPGFTPGKTMRLKGMGKHLGNWRGDLYVRIVSA